MKTIYIVRHATAVDRSADLPDFDRQLNEKGRKESAQMAQIFSSYDDRPDLLISSPAKRAMETAQIFAEIMNYPEDSIQAEEIIYDADSGENFLEIVQTLKNRVKSVMLFGHEPTLSEFISTLFPAYNRGLPKAGIVGLQYESRSWKSITSGMGIIHYIRFPKGKAPALKILEKSLEKTLKDRIYSAMELFDPETAQQSQKNIKKHSKKVSKKFIEQMAKIKY